MIKIICNGCNKELEYYYITIERNYLLFNSFIPSAVKEHYCADCFTKMMKENKEEEKKK